jgi:hypothetical protein
LSIAAKFIRIANQDVRLDSITRLATEPVLRSPDTVAYYVYVADGGILSVSRSEYNNIRGALMPTKRKSKQTKEVAE